MFILKKIQNITVHTMLKKVALPIHVQTLPHKTPIHCGPYLPYHSSELSPINVPDLQMMFVSLKLSAHSLSWSNLGLLPKMGFPDIEILDYLFS